MDINQKYIDMGGSFHVLDGHVDFPKITISDIFNSHYIGPEARIQALVLFIWLVYGYEDSYYDSLIIAYQEKENLNNMIEGNSKAIVKSLGLSRKHHGCLKGFSPVEVVKAISEVCELDNSETYSKIYELLKIYVTEINLDESFLLSVQEPYSTREKRTTHDSSSKNPLPDFPPLCVRNLKYPNTRWSNRIKEIVIYDWLVNGFSKNRIMQHIETDIQQTVKVKWTYGLSFYDPFFILSSVGLTKSHHGIFHRMEKDRFLGILSNTEEYYGGDSYKSIRNSLLSYLGDKGQERIQNPLLVEGPFEQEPVSQIQSQALNAEKTEWQNSLEKDGIKRALLVSSKDKSIVLSDIGKVFPPLTPQNINLQPNDKGRTKIRELVAFNWLVTGLTKIVINRRISQEIIENNKTGIYKTTFYYRCDEILSELGLENIHQGIFKGLRRVQYLSILDQAVNYYDSAQYRAIREILWSYIGPNSAPSCNMSSLDWPI